LRATRGGASMMCSSTRSRRMGSSVSIMAAAPYCIFIQYITPLPHQIQAPAAR
jgi:hypothetical protein